MGDKIFLILILVLFLFSSVADTGKLEFYSEKRMSHENKNYVFLSHPLQEFKKPAKQLSEENHSYSSGFSSAEVIVKFKKDFSSFLDFDSNQSLTVKIPSINSLNQKYDLKKIDKVQADGNNKCFFEDVYKFSFPEDADVFQIAKEYEKNPYVEYAEPNYIFHICSEPNDAYFDQQWALNQSNDCDIDAPEAWDINTGSSNIVVAVIDTGVDWDHPDLTDNIWNNTDEVLNGLDDDNNGFIDDIRGWDFYNNDSNPMDDNGHGTHCAGIIGAIGNNTLGVAGVCWNVSIMPLKAFSSGGYGNTDDLANAIYYAVDNGADIISMSWGGDSESTLLYSAIEYAYNNGLTLVAAAGNDNTTTRLYPAGYEEVIAVAATNSTDCKASFSNWGSWVDVAAPGVDIYSTFFNNTYYSESGTSMACPYVAGLAGLILSNNSSFSQTQIKNILKSTVDGVNSDRYIGTGRINAYKAIIVDSIPNAILNRTLSDNQVSGMIDIIGTANGSNFAEYSIYYGQGVYPSSWSYIDGDSNMTNDSLLAKWDTTVVDDGLYTLKLLVNSSVGNNAIDMLLIIVNNTLSTLYVGGCGSGNYTRIQDAIDNASDDDTVFVYNGTYYENIIINKSVNLIGEDENSTVIDGNGSSDVVYISSDWVNISGFTIQNSQANYTGVSIYSNHVSVSGNIIRNNGYGVYFYSSSNNTFTGNIVTNNTNGIYLYNSSNLNIILNEVINNTEYGIFVNLSNYNNINNNSVSNNTNISSPAIGIYLYYSTGNNLFNNIFNNNSIFILGEEKSHYMHSIQNNTVNGKQLYYYKNDNSGVTVPSDTGAVILVNCTNATIVDLRISFVDVGIETVYSDNITISNCSMRNATYGIYISYINKSNISDNVFTNSSYVCIRVAGSNFTNLEYNNMTNNVFGMIIINGENNTIRYNTFNTTLLGLWLSDSWNNNIYYNNFLNGDSIYAKDNSNNTWYNSTTLQGNYWFDFDETSEGAYDDNSDGIVDTPYNVSGGSNQDLYPLMYKRVSPPVFVWVDDNYTSSTPGWREDHFSIIQDGIDAVLENGTVYIYNGTYYENIIVNKSITIQGEDKNATIVDGSSGYGFHIQSNDTTIKNMTVTNCTSIFAGVGVIVHNSSFIVQNVTLDNLTVHSNSVGVYLNSATNCIVKSCNVYSNTFLGLTLQNAPYNTFQNNVFVDDGLTINGSQLPHFIHTINSNTVNSKPLLYYKNQSNLVLDSSVGQIILANCINIAIKNITLNNTDIGAYSAFSNNINISNCSFVNAPIQLYYTNNSTISSNNIYNNTNGDGINLPHSNNNTISSNNIYNNGDDGIQLISSDNNTIVSNSIYNNSVGVRLSSSNSNTIYNNNFNNTGNSIDDGANYWNTTKTTETNIIDGLYLGGNYWSDYTGADVDHDGLGDTLTPYNSSSNITMGGDYLPLVVSPSVSTSSPTGNSVSISTNIVITFSKSMNQTTVQDNFSISPSVTGSYSWSNNNRTLTFNPNSNLNYKTLYTVVVGWNATDIFGNVMLNNYSWSFTTEQQSYTPSGPIGPSDDNNAPVADPDGPYYGKVYIAIVFNASGSSDSDGSIAGYRWDFNNDGKYDTDWLTSPIATYVYSSPGNYTVKLQVKDNEGLTATATTFAIVNESTVGLQPPVADADGPYSGLTYQNITFDGSKSYDPDGNIVNYTWDLGDGTILYGEQVVHSYNTSGVFNVTLTVIDNDSLSSSNTTAVNIILDRDGDGWSDVEEQKYYTDANNSEDYPPDNDFDKLPDYVDDDDDNDGLPDYIENALQSNPYNSGDVIKLTIEENKTFYLVDQSNDGTYNILYDPVGKITETKKQADNTYLLDIDGDSKYDHVYNYANQKVFPYKPKENFEIPWDLIVIIIAIVCIAVLLVFYIWRNRIE